MQPITAQTLTNATNHSTNTRNTYPSIYFHLPFWAAWRAITMHYESTGLKKAKVSHCSGIHRTDLDILDGRRKVL